MNAIATRVRLAWLAAVTLFAGAAVAACGLPSAQSPARSSLVVWPERQLLLVGDSGSGTLRVFRLIGERPVLVAQWRGAGRERVLDIRVDGVRGGVWVLGDSSLDLHAVDSGAIVERRVIATARRIPPASSGAS